MSRTLEIAALIGLGTFSSSCHSLSALNDTTLPPIEGPVERLTERPINVLTPDRAESLCDYEIREWLDKNPQGQSALLDSAKDILDPVVKGKVLISVLSNSSDLHSLGLLIAQIGEEQIRSCANELKDLKPIAYEQLTSFIVLSRVAAEWPTTVPDLHSVSTGQAITEIRDQIMKRSALLKGSSSGINGSQRLSGLFESTLQSLDWIIEVSDTNEDLNSNVAVRQKVERQIEKLKFENRFLIGVVTSPDTTFESKHLAVLSEEFDKVPKCFSLFGRVTRIERTPQAEKGGDDTFCDWGTDTGVIRIFDLAVKDSGLGGRFLHEVGHSATPGFGDLQYGMSQHIAEGFGWRPLSSVFPTFESTYKYKSIPKDKQSKFLNDAVLWDATKRLSAREQRQAMSFVPELINDKADLIAVTVALDNGETTIYECVKVAGEWCVSGDRVDTSNGEYFISHWNKQWFAVSPRNLDGEYYLVSPRECFAEAASLFWRAPEYLQTYDEIAYEVCKKALR